MPQAAAVVGIISSLVQIGTSIAGAVQGSKAASQQGDYAMKVARMEADSRAEEERFAAARARANQYRGVVGTSGSPLLDDLTNATRIQRHWNDRIFQGRVSAYEAQLAGQGAQSRGLFGAAGGGLSIASMLFRMKDPTGGTGSTGSSPPLLNDLPFFNQA